ncbi:AP2/ERF domain-containing protein [Psidium guajava]|nr:AP2/ERF domain-containing protein [Psidium guajava]
MSEMARETAAGVAAGSGKPADSGDSTKYKGVRKRKWGKWVSEVRLPNSRERIWLGSYDSAEKAARAFDAAQFCLRGRNARFNFPDDPPPPDMARGRSLSSQEIQVAAAQFANSAAPAAASGPSRRNSNNHDLSSEYQPAASELQAESASPSVSEGTVQMDMDMGGGPFLDLLSGSMGSGNYASDYGLFPGYDEFTTNDYFGPATIPNMGFGDENFDGLPMQDSFLWNF